MMRLRNVLLDYADPDRAPAGRSGSRRLTEDERASLKRDLAKVRNSNQGLVWTAELHTVKSKMPSKAGGMVSISAGSVYRPSPNSIARAGAIWLG